MSGEEAATILEEAKEGPWAVLDVPMGASLEEIKSAFRKLMYKWHPDHNNDPNATAMTQRIIAAYTILTGG